MTASKQTDALALHRLIRQLEKVERLITSMERHMDGLEALCQDAGLIPAKRPELQVIEGGERA